MRADTKPNPQLLIVCYSVPGRGGASTSAYSLFEMMSRDGARVAHLNLVDEKYEEYYRHRFGDRVGNPQGLSDVHNCRLRRPLRKRQPDLDKFLDSLSPDLVLTVSHLPTVLVKECLPDTPVIFLTSGCAQAKSHIESGLARDAVDLMQRFRSEPGPEVLEENERKAVEVADLIVTHSALTEWLYRRFFPAAGEKIHHQVLWRAQWIRASILSRGAPARPFRDRDIDALFVASSWNRPIKNYPLLRELASRGGRARIHIVGEIPERLPGAVHHGLVTSPRAMAELYGRAKAVVCPSLFDAAPGILFEASAMECNVIASRNCGNWMICNEVLLAQRVDASEFERAMQLGRGARYADNMQGFLEADSYVALLKLIALRAGGTAASMRTA